MNQRRMSKKAEISVAAVMALVAMAAAILFLPGCSGFKITKGVVIEKIYEPHQVHTIFIRQKIGEMYHLMPYKVYDDEDFILIIQGRRRTGYVAKTVEQKVYVKESVFMRYDIGDEFDADTEPCAPKDGAPIKKRVE